jgi:hypothetical protein
MPMSTPAAAAKAAPTAMAAASRSGAEGMAWARAKAAVVPVKAPMDMKPAWPRLSSPRMPTVRFRDSAITT